MVPAWYLMGASVLTLIALKAFPEKAVTDACAACASPPPA
jgi:hypothetical protein